MAQITLRGLDPGIEKEIREKARKSGKSINRVILDILQKSKDPKPKRLPRTNTLKRLAGGWNDEDASQFIESIKLCEQIDEDIWK